MLMVDWVKLVLIINTKIKKAKLWDPNIKLPPLVLLCNT